MESKALVNFIEEHSEYGDHQTIIRRLKKKGIKCNAQDVWKVLNPNSPSAISRPVPNRKLFPILEDFKDFLTERIAARKAILELPVMEDQPSPN